MRWFNISPHSEGHWVSEREINQERSRIKEHTGPDGRHIFYACGENHGVLQQKEFDNLRDAKKWVRDCTGWSGNP